MRVGVGQSEGVRGGEGQDGDDLRSVPGAHDKAIAPKEHLCKLGMSIMLHGAASCYVVLHTMLRVRGTDRPRLNPCSQTPG